MSSQTSTFLIVFDIHVIGRFLQYMTLFSNDNSAQMTSLDKYLVLRSNRGFEDIGFLLDIIDLVDCLPHPRDRLLLLLLLGTEEGRCSRDGDAAAKDGKGDDAGDEANRRPEDVLDWVQVVGGLLLVLVPPRPVERQLLAEDDRGVPPHANGGDGNRLALVKRAVALLTVEPEDSGQAVPHCILRTLKNFLHTHLMIAMVLFMTRVVPTIVNI